MLWYSNPQNSLKATLKAKEIYENLGMPKQIIYLDEKIRRITERINRTTNKNGNINQ